MPNVGSMWALGVANLLFTAIGLIAVTTLLGFPLFLGAAVLSVPQETVVRALAYSSPVWAPIGAGFGLFTAVRLMQGVRRGAESIERNPREVDDPSWLLWGFVAALGAIALGAYLLF
jgi:hypothetical protein